MKAYARSLIRVGLAVALVIAGVTSLSAQLDPLIGVKGVPPNVLVVFDTSFRMLFDGAGNYYDPKTYNRTDDTPVANSLGVSDPTYRRIYQGLMFEPNILPDSKYFTSDIVAVPSSATGYATFWNATRLQMGKAGLLQAVRENPSLVRWGLMKLRQNNEAWRTGSNCDLGAVRVTSNPNLTNKSDKNPCDVDIPSLGNRYGTYSPFTSGPNFNVSAASSDALLYGIGTSNATANIMVAAQQPMGSGILIPAGQDISTYQDRPLTFALSDARAHVSNVMIADALRDCRNTVVVLIAGGKDDGDASYLNANNVLSTAASFSSVTAGGVTRRVPIVVVGVRTNAADSAQLAAVAAASGGQFFPASSAADVAKAVNHAVQLGFAKAADFDAGRTSEFSMVSPIVGTVNLVGARNASGALLPNTSIVASSGPAAGQFVPQRSNMMIAGGFGLPGFDARLRAFRVFKPVADSTRPTGWRFTADGTPLWPDLDGRPQYAGMARTPASSASRNIYTYIPNGAGGGQMVAFTLAEAATIGPHLGGADPLEVIPFVRNQPLGALIGSTPAIMDPPSLDPPPDAAYGFPGTSGTFAGTYKDRRAMIFFGANDGMVHAVDARTGFEVWAFIPYNLLPKLRTLLDGQSVEMFDYFVDSSPKVAEVKIGGTWKTMLIIGQSYGGTFYSAFDVSAAGMGVAPDADGLTAVNAMLAQFDTPGESIQFSWAFPNYSSFDPNITFFATLTDGFPGGTVRLFGDLKSTATNVEKRVGFTFSDPAVGPLIADRSVNAVITGSGYFPQIESLLPNRGGTPAGRALFVLDAATGLPLNNAGGSCIGTGCYDLGEVSNGRKNALQADVSASSDGFTPAVMFAYAGDTDGLYRRFDLTSSGSITATVLLNAGQPIYSSSALLFIGTNTRYLFFGTGSDLLSASTPGGGSSSGSGTKFKLIGLKDSTSVGVSGTLVLAFDLTPVSSSGWLTNGERPTSAPTVAGDIVFFTTTSSPLSLSCSDATTKIYAFTYVGSGAYDTNGDGKLSNNESPLITTATGRGTAPFIVDQHLFLGTSSVLGTGITVLGDPNDFNNGVGQVSVRILSWREIR